jgi:two-component system chemotaxis response regulator CheB
MRVLVVDNRAAYRKWLGDILRSLSCVERVGTTGTLGTAKTLLAPLRPDLLILDMEVSDAEGMDLLDQCRQQTPELGAIVLSGAGQASRERTIRALERGAFDFITRPAEPCRETDRRLFREALMRTVSAYARECDIKRLLQRRGASLDATSKPSAPTASGPRRQARPGSQAVVLGISTGGPNALREVIPRLPGDLGVPLLVVQHMPPVFTKSLANSLNAKSALHVVEGQDGMRVESNRVIIAPGGRHMEVCRAPDRLGHVLRLTEDPPENGCRPAVDVLFRSAAQVYEGRVTAVVMTGMGCDGKRGTALLKQQGAATIAQDEQTCVVYGMPKEVIEAGLIDTVVPLAAIADTICKTLASRRKAVPV